MWVPALDLGEKPVTDGSGDWGDPETQNPVTGHQEAAGSKSHLPGRKRLARLFCHLTKKKRKKKGKPRREQGIRRMLRPEMGLGERVPEGGEERLQRTQGRFSHPNSREGLGAKGEEEERDKWV